ncbi:MAG: PAS domain S-box protein [Bryobacteraceae bacterium]
MNPTSSRAGAISGAGEDEPLNGHAPLTETRLIERLLRESSLPVIVADHLGIICDLNGEFERVWGWPRARIVGEALAVLVPSEFHNAHHAGFSRFLVAGRGTILGQPLGLHMIDGAGRRVAAEICLCAEKVSGEWRFAATAEPAP